MTLLIDGNVDFSAEVDGRVMAGTLRAHGESLEVAVDDPRLLGGSGTEPARELASRLCDLGLQMVVTADRPLVTLGVAKAPYFHRKVTGSRHIRIHSFGAALRLLRLRSQSRNATPLVPPPTPLPLAPTFMRRPRQPTTTFDPDRGGYPRLVVAPDPHPRPGDRQPVFHLGELSTIGSGAEAEIQLAGLLGRHAEVRHTDDDEFEIVPLDARGEVRVHGAAIYAPTQLHTGSRVELGSWTLSFYREEYADHGRPYGGRMGGELGRQRLQPPPSGAKPVPWSAPAGTE